MVLSSPLVVRPPRRATVLTDASYDQRWKVGGWAAWVRSDGDQRPLTMSGVLKGPPIENSTYAEVMAALNGIWLARNHAHATHLLVQSDCMAVIHLIQGQMKSPGLLQLWATGLGRDDMAGVQLVARHVKGHGQVKDARTYVNAWCDEYARLHMQKARHRAKHRKDHSAGH